MNYLRVKWKINAEIKRSKVYIIKREWGITVLFLLILIEINLQEFARVHMSKFRWIFNRTNGNSVEEFKKKKKKPRRAQKHVARWSGTKGRDATSR